MKTNLGKLLDEKLFDGKERRKFVRIGESLPVKFRINNGVTSPDWKECISRDISRGGICVQINGVTGEFKEKILNPDSTIELEIGLSMLTTVRAKGDLCSLKVVGRAVWNHFENETLEAGIRFTEINPEDDIVISDFVVHKYLEKYGGIWK